MKNFSIFKGIRELHGKAGNYQVHDDGRVFKFIAGAWVFIGRILPGKTNTATYRECAEIDDGQ